MATADRKNQTIKLRDGRTLGYVECGDLEGKPVFHFHGYPGSRLEATLLHEQAAKAGVHLIGIDRPGMGFSSFQPGRELLDWPDDVIQLADALGLERFAVEGISGGGPYAAACAYKIPQRLTACGIIAGVGPMDLGSEGMMRSNQVIFFVARRIPWLLRPLMWWSMGRFSHDEAAMTKMMAKHAQQLPEPDRRVLEGDPEFKKLFVRESMEAFRQGTKGPAHEGRIYAKPWGFKLEEITCEKVFLWHGELDVNVPIAMGRFMADVIPNCQAKFYPDEAHLSVAFNNLEDIVSAMVS